MLLMVLLITAGYLFKMRGTGGWRDAATIGLVMDVWRGTQASLKCVFCAMQQREPLPMLLLSALGTQTSGNLGCQAVSFRACLWVGTVLCKLFLQALATNLLVMLRAIFVSSPAPAVGWKPWLGPWLQLPVLELKPRLSNSLVLLRTHL